MITDKHFKTEREMNGGRQRIYSFGNGYGLSAINAKVAHSYPFAWEIAVLKFKNEKETDWELDYDTGLTEDTETFMTDDETNEWIENAIDYMKAYP